MIEIRNLTKRFGTLTAVDDVSFTVERGTVLGFLGPNGAGKSTTMKMVTGFLTPDSGTVTVSGYDLATRPVEVKRRIGYLPEGAPLYGDMTPRAFLEFVAQVRGLRGVERRSCIDAVVDKVSLEAVLEQPIDTLSKGFKRRVGLAQAILHDPEVLILDEPTDGLDPNQKHEVRELIRSMAAQKVIVLSTHILEEVDAVCGRTIIIAGGRIVSDGTPAELLARSRLHNAVSVAVRGAPDGILEALGAIDGAAGAELVAQGEAHTLVRVYPRAGGASLAAAVGQVARSRSWEVDELHVERGRLDEVFREITAGGAG
jgi:ABC-2 type transport system ATP-binding protein